MNNQVTNWCIHDSVLLQSNLNIEFLEPPVYEVIRLIEGLPLFLEAHMARFSNSVKLASLEGKLTADEILEAVKKLASKTGLTHHNVRLEMGLTPNGVSWILFMVQTNYPENHMYTKGVHTVTTQITRENPHAKIFRKDYAQTISKIRSDSEAFEVILVDETGCVTEGSRSNLFFIKNDVVITAREEDVLLGISRLELSKLLLKLNISLELRAIKQNELPDFEACFLTGTSIKVLPIATIDSINYASSAHPLVLKIIDAFDDVLNNDIIKLKKVGGSI